MPRQRLQIRNLDKPVVSVEELQRELQERIVELNEALRRIELLESQLRGEDGFIATISSYLDMSGHRITKGARSKAPDDFVIRRELEEAFPGLFSPARSIRVTKKLEAEKGMTIPGAGGGSTAILTEDEINALITAQLGGAVATVGDGQPIDTEDLDGTDGATKGTLLFGLGPENKARLIRVTPAGELVSRNPVLEELLMQVIAALRQGHT
jgi:hypothetical protein